MIRIQRFFVVVLVKLFFCCPVAAFAFNPVLVGSLKMDNACGMTVVENYAYVVDEENGLEIIDIANPTKPISVGSFKASGVNNVAVVGHYAYVADRKGLKVVNVEDKVRPKLAGSYLGGCVFNDHYYIKNVLVDGSYAYVTSVHEYVKERGFGINSASQYEVQDALEIINIVNPENPVFEGKFATNNAIGMSLVGNYVYVVDGRDGLKIVDVTNKTHPKLAGTLKTAQACGVKVSKDYAYVADGKAGLKIVNVANPVKPILVGSFKTSNAKHVEIIDHYAYVADGEAGLKVINITNPANPVLEWDFGGTNNVNKVTVVDDLVYIVGADGFKVVADDFGFNEKRIDGLDARYLQLNARIDELTQQNTHLNEIIEQQNLFFRALFEQQKNTTKQQVEKMGLGIAEIFK